METRKVDMTSFWKLDMAAFKGETVTQGHANYCTNNGHATLQGASTWCHRCGENV